jgi:hypothetical protein
LHPSLLQLAAIGLAMPLMKVDERPAGESRMRTNTNSSSGRELERSAGPRRSAKPQLGKSKRLTSAVGGAVALGALALCGGFAYATPFTPPGEEAGLDASHPLPEGVYFVNIYGTGGDYVFDDKKSNLSFDVPVILWATPWQPNFLGFTGRFEVIAAAPVVDNWGFACSSIPPTSVPCGSTNFGRDFTGMYNPLFMAGFAWDLGGGWGFSSFNGGYGPIDNEFRGTNDIWVYNNRSWIGWTGMLFPGGMKDGGSGIKGTFAVENVYGLAGNNLRTHVRNVPDYDNVNLTAYVTLGKWDLGLVGFYSTDLENLPTTTLPSYQCPGHKTNLNVKCAQSRAGIGPLVQYDFPGISVQANYTFDVYDNNYHNLDGSRMQINQFWLKTVIPLWTAPKLETSLK